MWKRSDRWLKPISAGAMIAAVAVGGSYAAALAEMPAPRMVPVFQEYCLRDGVSYGATLAAIVTSGWDEVPQPSVDIAALSRVPSREAVNMYRSWDSVRQWQRMVDGKRFNIILATFPKKNYYRHLCAVSVVSAETAMTEMKTMREAVAPVGLKAWNTDIPHYQEYTGKLHDKRRARAEIFSRSGLLYSPAVHLSIAYQ